MKAVVFKKLSFIGNTIKIGLAMVLPVLFIGSMTVLLNGLPIPGYQDFLDSFPGGTLRSILQTIQTATVGILAIYLTIALNVSYTNPVIYNPLMLILLYQGYLFSPAVDREELIARKTPEA